MANSCLLKLAYFSQKYYCQDIGLVLSSEENYTCLFSAIQRLLSSLGDNAEIIGNIIIIITLFQEDTIFGMNASLTYGPQIQRHALDNYITMKHINSMYKTGEVCVHRACCERATQPYSLGEGGTIYPGPRPAGVTTRSPRMVTECLLSRSMLIKMYLPFHDTCLYMYLVFIVSQFHVDAHSVYLVFQIAKMFWHNNSIRKHEYVYHYNNYPVWRVLSVLAVLLWPFDAQHTSIDVRARFSIFDLWSFSDRSTILIGRAPHHFASHWWARVAF